MQLPSVYSDARASAAAFFQGEMCSEKRCKSSGLDHVVDHELQRRWTPIFCGQLDRLYPSMPRASPDIFQPDRTGASIDKGKLQSAVDAVTGVFIICNLREILTFWTRMFRRLYFHTPLDGS